jgi:hypothetical protein
MQEPARAAPSVVNRPHAPQSPTFACENLPVATAPKHIRLSDPELAGVYEIVERRPDGSLLLRPEVERLSDVLRETDGAVFNDEEFIAHLERVAATEDDLPAENSS